MIISTAEIRVLPVFSISMNKKFFSILLLFVKTLKRCLENHNLNDTKGMPFFSRRGDFWQFGSTEKLKIVSLYFTTTASQYF